MNRQIVYILSTNYAGSHFLALQLGSHSRCASIGELHHLRRKDTRHRACHACPSDRDCPVFSGIRQQPVRNFYDLIFTNLAALNPAVTTVIDNSKKVRWARRFVNLPGYTQKYIHLIRDPRALVRRWMLNPDVRAKKKMRFKAARHWWTHLREILTCEEAWIYVWHWLYQNKQISDFISQCNLDAKLVTYHDLVSDTDQVLVGLMGWLGQEYEPGQKEYWKAAHHGSLKKTYLRPPPDGQNKCDLRWKEFLTPRLQQTILEHPQLRTYISGLGLAWDPDKGLSGKQSQS